MPKTLIDCKALCETKLVFDRYSTEAVGKKVLKKQAGPAKARPVLTTL
jgi:hypothetical protein